MDIFVDFVWWIVLFCLFRMKKCFVPGGIFLPGREAADYERQKTAFFKTG